MRRANHPGGNVSARRRATLSDVARHAGVSPVTVSRAIRHPEMVSEDLRRRIDEAVRSLNYIPNNLASALASTRTHIVGVIVPALAIASLTIAVNIVIDNLPGRGRSGARERGGR